MNNNNNNLNPDVKIVVQSDGARGPATELSEDEHPLMSDEEHKEEETNYLNLLKLKEEIQAGSKRTSLCAQLRAKVCQKPERPKELGLIIIVAILFLLIVIGLVVIFSFYQEDTYYVYRREGFTVNGKTQQIAFTDKNNQEKLKGTIFQAKAGGKLPYDCTTPDLKNTGSLCLEWRNNLRVVIKPKTQNELNNNTDLMCHDVVWEPLSSATSLSDTGRQMVDCYTMSKGDQWFGLGLLNGQGWPLQDLQFEKQPFVTSDPFSSSIFGAALEPYLLSSAGATITVRSQLPLEVSVGGDGAGDKKICFYVTTDTAAVGRNRTKGLEYTTCVADNILKAHTGSFSLLTNQTVSTTKAERVPLDLALIESPIWSTWDYLGSDIKEIQLEQFALKIKSLGGIFGSQDLFLIDQGWELQNGDFIFNKSIFPNPSGLISKIKSMGFKVGLWVHPMVAATSETFKNYSSQEGVLAEGEDKGVPRLSLWWSGPHRASYQMPVASIINMTSSASNYLEHTRSLQRSFDLHLLQHCHGFSENFFSKTGPSDPNLHTHEYSKAVELNSIVQAVYKNQMEPVLLRLTGGVSKWDGPHSIKSLIQDALSLSLIGYPLFVPQAVGGSHYARTEGELTKELYIRWMQVSIFLPLLHLSTPPYMFDNETVEIFRQLMSIRHRVVLPELRRYGPQVVRGAAVGFLKPLCMITSDPEALVCNDQFVVGEKILVVPILNEGVRSRNVYIPAGLWEAGTGHKIHVGPKTLLDYPAPLNTVPYFFRK